MNTNKEEKKDILQKKFYKKPKNLVIALLLFFTVIGSYAYFSKEDTIDVNSIIAEKGELIQEVSVTGRVQPVESVNLGFEISGKVKEIFADVGDSVKKGQKLIALGNADLLAQLRQVQAGVSSAKAQLSQYKAAVDIQQAKLDEYKRGTRSEEIRIAKTTVTNAENSLMDSEKNLENVETKAYLDLKQDYSVALTTLQSVVSSAKSALLTVTDIQYAHFNGNDSDSSIVASAKKDAIYALLGEVDGGRWQTSSISYASGGIYGSVQSMTINSSDSDLDYAATQTIDALRKVKNALNSIPINLKLTSAEKTSIDTEKTSIGTEISSVSSVKQIIAVQKATNQSSISTAQTAVNTAKNTLAVANDQLNLKKAGYTTQQIKAQEALVNQAKANLDSQKAILNQAYANVQKADAQLAKTIIYSPIDGLVTKMGAKIGEIIFPSSGSSGVISIISDQNFEITVNIPEVDIAKIKIADKAQITLDAYGDDIVFDAFVTSIDPAETIYEGIPTYKVILQFSENSERIKSGMTANIDILTNKLDSVIAVPQRVVIEKNGIKYIRILKMITDEKGVQVEGIVESEVKTGLRGSSGEIEIVEGINEGDEVVLSINE